MQPKLSPGINHIEFWVTDLEKSIKFYHSFLSLIGWKKVNDISFSDGRMIIYFIGMKGVEKVRSLGIRHLCFQAPEKEQVDQVSHALADLGAEVIRGPQFMPYSKDYYTIDFYDPDGQVIEVAHTPFSNMGS
jgi:catechol 2,3-dioxygenase-like lactoylglutathione lyase family enzyme